LLNTISADQTHLTEKFIKGLILSKIKNDLNHLFRQGENGLLDMKAYVDFRHDEKSFADLLATNTQRYADFWIYYSGPTPKMTILLGKSQELEREADRFDELWRVYTEKYPSFYTVMSDIYFLYNRLVRNLPFTVEKMEMNSSWRRRAIHDSQQNTDA